MAGKIDAMVPWRPRHLSFEVTKEAREWANDLAHKIRTRQVFCGINSPDIQAAHYMLKAVQITDVAIFISLTK